MNNHRANGQAPQQLVLPGADLAPGVTHAPASLRLPTIVRDLLEQVAPDCRPAEARKRITEWLTSQRAGGEFLPKTVYKRFAYELTRMRLDLVPTCIDRFVPNAVKRGLTHKPRRMREKQQLIDPVVVLRDAHNTTDARRRFAAERDLALAYLSLWIVNDKELTGAWDSRIWDQDKKTAQDRNMYLDYLRRRKVITGGTGTVHPVVAHDVNPPHRCLGIAVHGAIEFVTGDLTQGKQAKIEEVDVINLNLPGGAIPALFLPRRKGILQTIGKMLLLRMGTPLNVPDRRGFRIVYRTEEDLAAGSALVRTKICSELDSKSHLEHTDTPINPYAAPNLVIIRDSAAFHDRIIEVQHMLARQHMDVKRSKGLEQHMLYHRRQYTAPHGLFSELFPPEFYGIDWQLPEVQLAMDEHICARIIL